MAFRSLLQHESLADPRSNGSRKHAECRKGLVTAGTLESLRMRTSISVELAFAWHARPATKHTGSLLDVQSHDKLVGFEDR